MKSIDQFFNRTRKPGYDCLDFACEVWEYLVPGDQRLQGLKNLRNGNERLKPSVIKMFDKLTHPVSPCIVLMHRNDLEPHVGIFYADRILHLPSDYVISQLPKIAKGYYSGLDYYK